ncbi:MAG: PAS domain-containing protein [Desulfomonilaceae bacterium]
MKPTIDRQLEKLAEWLSVRKWLLFPIAIVVPLSFTGINHYFSGKDFFTDLGDYVELFVEMIVLGGIGVHICYMIAERAKIIQTLQESERRYRTLFESAGDCIYILDADGDRPGQIVSANPAAAEMHGYTVDEMLSRHIVYLDTPESARSVQERIERVLKRETVKEETTHRRKDGTVFPLEINARLLELGGQKYVLAIDRDITDRKAAEAALRTSEAQLSNALTMAHLGHWEYDVTEDLFTFNDHFYKIFRTTADQVGGYTMSSADYAGRFVHPDDISLWSVMKSGKPLIPPIPTSANSWNTEFSMPMERSATSLSDTRSSKTT